MGSVVGPRSTADVRQFIVEATGLPVEGLEFKRTPSGLLTLRCEYKDAKGHTKTKQIALGQRLAKPMDEVVDLAVVMTEWMTHGEGHMLDLLDSSKDAETVQ